MLHERVLPRTANRDATPELVVWTSLWGRSLPYVMGEAEQKRRFSYALRRAMDARNVSGRALAKSLDLDPRRITGWLGGKGLPNIYESQALAAALKVDEALFRDPPEVPPPPPEPYYPIEEYLLGSATKEGRRRATKHPGQQGPRTPSLMPERHPRDTAAERG